MTSITLNLTEAELKQAVQDYAEKKGLVATDRFFVSIQTIPGDRPWDRACTEATVGGLALKEAGK